MQDGNKTHTLLSALDAYPRRYTTPPSGRSPGFRQNTAGTPLCPLTGYPIPTEACASCLNPTYLFRDFVVRIFYQLGNYCCWKVPLTIVRVVVRPVPVLVSPGYSALMDCFAGLYGLSHRCLCWRHRRCLFRYNLETLL